MSRMPLIPFGFSEDLSQSVSQSSLKQAGDCVMVGLNGILFCDVLISSDMMFAVIQCDVHCDVVVGA